MGKAFKEWAVAARESGLFHCKPCDVPGCAEPPLQFQNTCRQHTERFPKMGIREKKAERDEV
jgi:hypothetical protein